MRTLEERPFVVRLLVVIVLAIALCVVCRGLSIALADLWGRW
jgi:hypothetical protein